MIVSPRQARIYALLSLLLLHCVACSSSGSNDDAATSGDANVAGDFNSDLSLDVKIADVPTFDIPTVDQLFEETGIDHDLLSDTLFVDLSGDLLSTDSVDLALPDTVGDVPLPDQTGDLQLPDLGDITISEVEADAALPDQADLPIPDIADDQVDLPTVDIADDGSTASDFAGFDGSDVPVADQIEDQSSADQSVSTPTCSITNPNGTSPLQMGDVSIIFDVADDNSPTVTILLEYSTDGGFVFKPASVAPTSPPPFNTNPTVAPAGKGNVFVWDSANDVFGSANAEFRIVVDDGSAQSTCETLFSVSN